jgi:hypothetical protein
VTRIGDLEKRIKRATSLEELGETLWELLSGPYEVMPGGQLIEIKVFVDDVDDVRVEIRTREHGIPHFHAIVQGRDASFDIETGRLIIGDLNSRHLRLIRDWWTEQASGSLMAIWNETRSS